MHQSNCFQRMYIFLQMLVLFLLWRAGWNFYVDDDHDWMIELVQDGEDLEKHQEKMKEDGLYGSILKCAKHHAIVDIRSGVGRPCNLKSGVIYVVCSQDFSSMEICINSSWDKVQLCGSGDLYTKLGI